MERVAAYSPLFPTHETICTSHEQYIDVKEEARHLATYLVTGGDAKPILGAAHMIMYDTIRYYPTPYRADNRGRRRRRRRERNVTVAGTGEKDTWNAGYIQTPSDRHPFISVQYMTCVGVSRDV
jgi:hypothetical protein